ncbi:pyridoxine 5'-phosphate synthase [Alphaproteobacteria bacterium]|nr:pyridoxine 5'-phosphate synthase [Alphaproteobacteria bacterium]
MCKLGINIDHVATLRNARGQFHPDPLKAAMILKECEVDSITMHLREDRRHINDDDLFLIKDKVDLPINLEIAPTEEMTKIALKLNPRSVCFVPEKRMEVTTEGGLNVKSNMIKIKRLLNLLSNSKIKVACFIEPDFNQIDSLKSLGIKILEIHTGSYADAQTIEIMEKKLSLIKQASQYATELGFDCHAGHGLNYDNVFNIASIEEIKELNIGHFIIGESIFSGLKNSILKMKKIINLARK